MAEDGSDKESSPSAASLSTGDNKPELLHIPNGGPTLKTSPTQVNRNEWLKTAPSVRKLIELAQTPKPKPLAALLDDDHDTDPFPDTAPSSHGHRSHIKMPTVINNVMVEFGKQNDDSTELQEVALKAAQEFQLLTTKNDEIFREKEQFRTKYDDMIQTMNELQQKLSDAELYRDENDRLLSINGNLEVQIQVFSQEKCILEDTINELKSITKNDIETNNTITEDTNATNKVQNKNEEQLMAQISRMQKQRNDMETAFDAFKAEIDTKNKNISSLQQELSNTKQDMERTNETLNQTTEIYMQLEQSKQNQRSRYDRKLTIQSDQMEDDNTKRQLEFSKIIASQKKRIHELEIENREIQNKEIQNQYNRGKKGSKKLAHLRMRTKQDVFGGGAFDLDPFGPDAEEDAFVMNEHHSGISGDDEEYVQTTFHDVRDTMDDLPRTSIDDEDGYIISANHSQTASTQIEVANTTSCGCLSSWFSKLNRNKVKKLSSAKPLAVQEIRD